MLFKKKKKETVEKKKLLYRENIRVGCQADSQENVIRQVGQMLVDTGYVDQPYVDAMVEREKTCSQGNPPPSPPVIFAMDCWDISSI